MKFLIYSVQRAEWWKPNALGYTPDKNKAGRFTLEKAVEAVDDAKTVAVIPRHVLIPEREGGAS